MSIGKPSFAIFYRRNDTEHTRTYHSSEEEKVNFEMLNNNRLNSGKQNV
jgi:hypothetical protein